MSPLRRILVVGLPTAGLTVAASLALVGSPAAAVAERSQARPVAQATTCAAADRDNCDYGSPSGAGTATTPSRGHGGYGNVSPTPTTSKPTPAPSGTSPTGSVDTVPPTSPGVLASETPSPTPSGGVSAGHALPVTGAPASTILSLGVLLVAGGAVSVYYTRRRRNA